MIKRISASLLATAMILSSLSTICYGFDFQGTSDTLSNDALSAEDQIASIADGDETAVDYVIDAPIQNNGVFPEWKYENANENTQLTLAVLEDAFADTNETVSLLINSVDDLYNLALYSKNHDTSRCEITILAAEQLNLDGAKFMGLGSADHPFAGRLFCGFDNAVSVFKLSQNCAPLCAYLSDKASFTKISVIADGSHGGLAGVYLPTGTTAPAYTNLSVSGNVNNSYKTSIDSGRFANAGLLFGTVSVPDGNTAMINLAGVTVTPTDVTANEGNAGVLVGCLSGKLNFVGQIAFTGGNVIAKQGNAGYLVGQLNAGSELGFYTDTACSTGASVTLNSVNVTAYKTKTTDENGCAGGLIGLAADSAKLTAGAVTVSGEIAGGNAIGGLTGKSTDAIYTISFFTSTANLTGAFYNGGLFGYCTLSGVGYYNTSTPLTVADGTVSVTSSILPRTEGDPTVYEGGIAGYLSVNAGNYSVDYSGSTKTVRVEFRGGKCIAAYAGGLFGWYQAAAIAQTLTVTGAGTASAFVSSCLTAIGTKITSYGGLFGTVGAHSFCDLNGISETTNSTVYTSAGAGNLYTEKAGGIIGTISNGAMIKLGDVKVDGGFSVSQTGGDTSAKFGAGGGVIGQMNPGSVLVLTGTLTLGASTYANTNGISADNHAQYLGQIVGYQDNALIYGETSWTLVRNTASQGKTDDIGNYGSVIENGELGIISMSDAHVVTIASLAGTTSAVTLSNEKDFAKLSITLSSQGYFSAISGVGKENYSSLLTATITIGASFSLAGSGITCLTREDRESDPFRGTLEGGGNTVTLAIGEQRYGTTGGCGNGEIYGHKYAGIFAAIGTDAIIRNITVAGNITYGQQTASNNRCNDIDTYVGSIAGYSEGSKLTFTNVKTTVMITEERWNKDENGAGVTGYYGGLLGYYVPNGTGEILTVTGCEGGATFLGASGERGDTYTTGGLIGTVNTAAQTGITLNFSNTVLSGKISFSGSASNVKIGGLIGCIDSTLTSGAPATTVNLLGIDASKMEIDINETGAGSNTDTFAGGYLGYLWKQVDVRLDAGTTITTSTFGKSYSAQGNIAFGGLVYNVSGRFRIANTELTGSFTGSGTNKNVSDGILVCRGNDLYLILDKKTVTYFCTRTEDGGTYCDDIVGNNIVTIHEKGGIVTIEDGSAVGSMTTALWDITTEKRNINPNARYYYNIEGLDIKHNLSDGKNTYYSDVSNGTISSAAHLVMYNVLNYANNTFPLYYFAGSYSFSRTSLNQTANIDLTGYCYYPTSVSGMNYTAPAGGATLTFCYVDDTIDGDNPQKQHYLLQCGLFNDVKGTFKVTGLTLSGNVGFPGGTFSGALILGTATGSKNTSTGVISKCDITLTNCAISDLYVVGAGENFAPVLIYRIREYASLTVDGFNAIYTTSDKAGSSLIGDVGYVEGDQSASYITLKFNKLSITVNERPNLGQFVTSPFTMATLMNSLKGDSSTVKGEYNFTKAETAAGTVILGYELEDKNTEYYDSISKVQPDGSDKAATYNYKSDYQYYIKGAIGTGLLLINVKSVNLLDGCGTYGDPYIITSAGQWFAVFNYINNGSASDGWLVNKPTSTDCTDKESHTTYTYGSTEFPTKEEMASAYYSISGKIDLTVSAYSSYTGIGTSDIPFRGVIVGTGTISMPTATTTAVKNFGLINYSSGCVVKGITVEYSGTYLVTDRDAGVGGIIGWVSGGDNIIDEVQVSGFSLQTEVRYAYIGGLVGMVQSGGVIIRNMSAEQISTSEAAISTKGENYFYANPYIGRVLDGFVISENCELDNTDKNYTIVQPTVEKGSILVERYNNDAKRNIITLAKADDLFLLAAAVNSGSLAGALKGGYSGTYFRVRNATYAYVGGDPTNKDYKDDSETALKDNQVITKSNVTSSSPYLCSFFTTTENTPAVITSISATDRINSVNVTGDLNMTAYGNGFRGIGAKYTSDNKPAGLSLKLGQNGTAVGFNGNGKTITLNTNLSQYSLATNSFQQETYFIRDISLLGKQYTDGTAVVTNFTLSGKITLENYFQATGTVLGNNYAQNASGVDANVGGIWSSVDSGKGTIKNVTLSNFTIQSTGNAGGLIASETSNLTITDCAFSTLNVTGHGCSGGFIGTASGNNTVEITFPNVTACKDAEILMDLADPKDETSSGGLIGFSNVELTITGAENKTTFSNIKVMADAKNDTGSWRVSLGGILGIYKSKSTSSDATISYMVIKDSYISANRTSTLTSVLDSSAYKRGSAGGILGCEEESKRATVTVDYCDVINTKVYALNNAGGIVSEYRNTNMNITNCSVRDSEVIGVSHAGGCYGYSQGTTAQAVIDNFTISGTVIAAYNYNTTSVAGIFGDTGSNLNLTNSSVTNCLLVGPSASGIGDPYTVSLKSNQNAFRISDVTVSGTTIVALYGMAGAISSFVGKNTTMHLNHIQITDTKVLSTNRPSGTGNGETNRNNRDTDGVLISMISDASVFGTDIKVDNVLSGVMNDRTGTSAVDLTNGLIKTMFPDFKEDDTPTDEKITATLANVTTGAKTYRVVGTCTGTVQLSLVGFSFHITDETYYRMPANANSTGYTGAILYADYDGKATTAEEVTKKPSADFTGPDSTGFIGYGEGVSFGQIQKIVNEQGGDGVNRYSLYTPKLLGANSTYLNYTSITDGILSDNNKELPLLYVSGNEDELIKEYLNAMTNGGFSQMLNDNGTSGGVTMEVTSSVYSVSDTGMVLTKMADGNASIEFSGNTFSSTKHYDSLKNGNGTITVLTITITNPSDGLTEDYVNGSYVMHILVYYPQILNAQTYISMLNREEYGIQSFSKENGAISIMTGDTFAAYIEFAYNAVRISDEWNYEKRIDITSNGTTDGSALINLPVGTKLTLLPLNSTSNGQVDPGGFLPYYYNLTQEASSINLSDFKRGTNPYQTVSLDQLPATKAVSSLDEGEDANCGVERYILIVEIPQFEGDSKRIFHLHPTIDETNGQVHNVQLEGETTASQYVTIWPEVKMSINMTPDKPNISMTEPLTFQSTINITYFTGYLGVVNQAGEKMCGLVRYSLTTSDSQAVVFPKGTKITVNGETFTLSSDELYFDYSFKDGKGNNLNLYEDTANNDRVLTQSVTVDFSDVEDATFNQLFDAENYHLSGTFFTTKDTNSPETGKSVNAEITVSANNTDSPIVNVTLNSDATLNVGANPLDSDDNNNGKINISLLLNLNQCSDDYITKLLQSPLVITATLSKKENVAGNLIYNKVDMSNSAPTISVGTTNGSAGMDQYVFTLNPNDAKDGWENVNYSQEYRQLHLNMTIDMNIEKLDLTDPAVFTNYKMEFSLTSDQQSGQQAVGSDYIIYSIAKIFTIMID